VKRLDPEQGIQRLAVKKFNAALLEQSPKEDWRTRLCTELGIKGAITCPPGWELVVTSLMKQLVLMGWDGELETARDLFGGLYVRLGESATDAMRYACRQAQRWSFQTCSRCGESEAKVRPRGRRIETSCVSCHDILMQEDPEGLQEPVFHV
jgi:hypothetical protein